MSSVTDAPSTRRRPPLDALHRVALVALAVAFALGAAAFMPAVGYDAPHTWPVGHAWAIFGRALGPLLALHHGAYHGAHQTVLGWLVGPFTAPALVGVLYSAATVVLLGVWGRRELGGAAGWLAALVYATTPAVVALATVPSHEHAGIFWLVLSWMLVRRAQARPPGVVGALALLGAGLMAAGADHGSLLGLACVAIVASWQADRERPRTLTAPLVLAAAVVVGAVLAMPPGGVHELLITMDARFFFGFDHLVRVGVMLAVLAAVVPALMLVPWLVMASFRRLRGRDLPGGSLPGTLLVVALFEIAVLREPGWSSNLLYLCAAAAVASASLVAMLLERVSARTVKLAATATLAAALVAPTAAQLVGVARWPREAHVELMQGMRTGQIEGHGRIVIAVAESMLEPGQRLYLGPGVACSLSCMDLGAPKTYLDADTLRDALPDDGLLVVWRHTAAHYPTLEGLPGWHVSGIDVLDLGGERRAEPTLRQLRLPLSRTLPRALSAPSDDALLRPLP